MRILLLCHSFNSLTQRLFVELRERGEEVSVEFDISDAVLREAVDLFEPDLVLAPFLKRAIPQDVLERAKCLIVHPGPPGDRGPSALDWAILEGRRALGRDPARSRAGTRRRAGLGHTQFSNARGEQVQSLPPRGYARARSPA